MKKILIIEDDKDVRTNLFELLSAEGYEVIQALDGEEGVRLTWEYQPDLILCDIRMPRLDGFGVLAILARDVNTATIPFIFLTTPREASDWRRSMELGADDYLAKPYTSSEVLRAIETRLRKRDILVQQARRKLDHLQVNLSQSLPYELLTHLSVILGYSEFFLNEQNSTPSISDPRQISQIMKEIHTSGLMLLHSIENYLLYMELETLLADADLLRSTRENSIISVNAVIGDFARIKAIQENRNDDLTIGLEDASLQISEIHLQKILEEILDNAFRFSPAGGPVTITGKVYLKSSQYSLRVQDHGRGMTHNQIGDILGTRQVERRTGAHSGPGLGFSVVKQLVAVYNGSISIQSTPGKDTVVEVFLPIASTGD